MEHDIAKRDYGNPFILFFFFLLACFGLLLFEVSFSIEIIYVAGGICALVLGFIDNRSNGTKDFVIYFLYVVGAVIAVFIFYYIMGLLARRTVSGPRSVFAVIVGIGIVPGYLIIKIYQSIVNRKLEDAYWDDYDARQGVNKNEGKS